MYEEQNLAGEPETEPTRSEEGLRSLGPDDVGRDRRLAVVALKACRTWLVRPAVLACTVGAALSAAGPAQAAITSVSVGKQTVPELNTLSGTIATFVTNNPAFGAPWTATIDWGDGTQTTATVTVNSDNGTVSGSHAYIEDGTYTVTVRVIEGGGGSPNTASAAATVTVTEDDIALATVGPITTSEGTTFSGPVASFIHPPSFDSASQFSATIDWADGTTTVGDITGMGGTFTISGSHTYTDELSNGIMRVSAR